MLGGWPGLQGSQSRSRTFDRLVCQQVATLSLSWLLHIMSCIWTNLSSCQSCLWVYAEPEIAVRDGRAKEKESKQIKPYNLSISYQKISNYYLKCVTKKYKRTRSASTRTKSNAATHCPTKSLLNSYFCLTKVSEQKRCHWGRQTGGVLHFFHFLGSLCGVGIQVYQRN